MTEPPYNPLDIGNLGRSVAEALVRQQALPLRDIARFSGAGIYAIYYTGSFGPYQALSRAHRESPDGHPIYIGKAVPPGARRGIPLTSTSSALHTRLREHQSSVRQAQNLDLDDFDYRYLVVESIWIPLGESLLISRFTPIWNNLVDGFGNHDPGAGRYKGIRPRWDVLHPGREWAFAPG